MPCNSDYLKPTNREAELQRTAKLYAFVLKQDGVTPPTRLIEATQNIYCVDDFVGDLCSYLRALRTQAPELFEATVYNARSKESRDLADWWEQHTEADQQREAEEEAQRILTQRVQKVLDKLTREDIEALEQEYGVIF